MYRGLVERLRNCATQAAPCKICDMIEDRSCSDTLMKQAADAIEKLSNVGSAYGRGWTLGYDSGRAESKQRWIPVTERLPENTNPVIAFCNGKAGNVSFEDSEIFAIYEESEGWWWDSYPEISHIPVTHWMPLPEPPKGETE